MLHTRVGTLELLSPLLTGSGTFGHDGAATRFVAAGDLGALVLKTVTPRPRPGNPPPRLVETPSGLLNSIGLENRGLAAFLRDTVPKLETLALPVIANAGGESVADFERMAEAFDAVACFAAIELNLSCPNVKGGLSFSASAAAVEEVVGACRRRTRKPLWAKLSPNVTRIQPLAQAAEAAGADALTVCNTLLGLVIDWRSRKPVLGAGFGGLSGPAVRPVAVRLVAEAQQAVKIPIVGSGGAQCADDVLQFLVAGASAVQVGTVNFRRPDAVSRIAGDMRALLAAEQTTVAALVGSLQMSRKPPPLPTTATAG
ncbi:MAG: dihydroorotate dehydrogenase [Planctomycetota bacterium]|nr:MAG: dihydroorotate dehydrogenase [Planctomycetota bacterium]